MKNVFIAMRKAIMGTALLIAGGAILVSCSKDVNDGNNDVDAAAIMAFNLAADRSQVTIGLSGNSLTNVPLAYNSYTGTYIGVFPGTRTVDAYDGSGVIATSPAYNFEMNKFYSVFVTGANGVYRNVITYDNFDSLSATSGNAYIRYINAIPDSSQSTVMISAAGSTVVNEQAAFTNVSEFKAVTPGQVTIDINNGGNIDADRTITVESRKVYTVLLTGIPGSTPTPVEIKFVTNGMLDEQPSGRIASSSSAKNSN